MLLGLLHKSKCEVVVGGGLGRGNLNEDEAHIPRLVRRVVGNNAGAELCAVALETQQLVAVRRLNMADLELTL